MEFIRKILSFIPILFLGAAAVLCNVALVAQSKIEPAKSDFTERQGQGQNKKKVASPNISKTMLLIDRGLAYPDGLYKGTLELGRGKINTMKRYSFRLYLKDNNRLYYFMDASEKIVYKLLYYQKDQANPKYQAELVILAWDPLRNTLHRKKDMSRHQRVFGGSLEYLDLALFPYSFSYVLADKKNKAELSGEAKKNDPSLLLGNSSAKKRVNVEQFPENIFTDLDKGVTVHILKPKQVSPYAELRARLKKEKLLSLDFYTPPKLLSRSLYLSDTKSIFNEELKKEESLGLITSFRLVDFQRDIFSFLELKSYDPRPIMKQSLFHPRFLAH